MAQIVGFFTHYAVVALLFAVGLKTTKTELRAAWASRTLILRSLFVLFLAVPVLTLGVVALFPLRPKAQELLLVMAVCSGSPTILRKESRRPEMLAIVALASSLVPLSTPAWLAAMDALLPVQLSADPSSLGKTVLLKQLLPLALGMALAALWPRRAGLLARVAWVVFAGGFALSVAGALWRGGRTLLGVTSSEWAAVGCVVVGSMGLGDWAGRPRPEDRRAMLDIATLGNPALAVAVVALSVPGVAAGALIAAYVVARALMLLTAKGLLALGQRARLSAG